MAGVLVVVSTVAHARVTTAAESYVWLLDWARAAAAADRFLDDWVDPDGRVVRRDQGGDTVSEGQAYAMAIAVAIGDEARFQKVWAWTQRELARPDGLYAWRWHDGAVVDDSPATDADLLIAGALALAGERFDNPRLTEAAAATSRAILAHETVRVDGRLVLVAGPWAVGGRVVNPSYMVVPIMSELWKQGELQWADVAAGSRDVIDELTTASPHLPPDWAEVDVSGNALIARPTGDPPSYGLDAVRIPVQLAADCSPRGRAIAARLWPFFLSQDVQVDRAYALDGREVTAGTHAAALAGAAGAASAAGADDSMRVLLDRASRWDAAHPSYYGAAWVALARLWLTTPLLGGCA